MKGASIKYLLKEGVRNLWSNRLMTFASVGVLTACLLIVGFAMLFSENVTSIVGFIEDQNEIIAYLETGNTEEQNQAIGEQLRKIADIDEVVYYSKDQVWEMQMEKLGSAANLFEDSGDNPFHAYYSLKEKDLSKISTTVKEIEQIDGIEEVSSSTGLAKTVVKVRQMVTLFGGAIILALVLVSLVIIANTIRAAVFTRRKEINIMKYVGATDGFIRFPFMVEGVILGIISALLAFLLIWGGYEALLRSLGSDMTVSFLASALSNTLPFKEVALRLGLSFLGAGILTGALGSVISVRNHLKV